MGGLTFPEVMWYSIFNIDGVFFLWRWGGGGGGTGGLEPPSPPASYASDICTFTVYIHPTLLALRRQRNIQYMVQKTLHMCSVNIFKIIIMCDINKLIHVNTS